MPSPVEGVLAGAAASPWLAVAGVAASVIGAGLSFFSGKKASSAADRAARREAKLEGKVTDERIRQISRQETIMAGQTVAATAGGGVKVGSGSSLAILADQASEFRRERQVTREVGATRARAALEGGSALATQYRYQGLTGAVGGLGQAFSIASDANFFKKPPPPGTG